MAGRCLRGRIKSFPHNHHSVMPILVVTFVSPVFLTRSWSPTFRPCENQHLRGIKYRDYAGGRLRTTCDVDCWGRWLTFRT